MILVNDVPTNFTSVNDSFVTSPFKIELPVKFSVINFTDFLRIEQVVNTFCTECIESIYWIVEEIFLFFIFLFFNNIIFVVLIKVHQLLM